MIAKIKKYTLLVHHHDYPELLNSLRDAGVVHIIEKRKLDENSVIGDDMKVLRRYDKAVKQITSMVPDAKPSELYDDPETILNGFESSMKEIENSKHKIELLKPEASRVRLWGDFDFTTVKKLKNSGWNLSLFICPEKKFQEKWQNDYALEIIRHEKGKICFAIIHKEDEIPDIDADHEVIPDRSAFSVDEEISLYRKKLEETESGIRQKAPLLLSSLMKGSNIIFSNIEYSSASEQAEKYADNHLFILEGWVPVSEKNKVDEILKKIDCYSIISEPDPNEKIPVILTNKKFAALFEPIAKLFALPDYRELDLTPFFAPFFMLFFGFCLGDTGYGLFFIIAGFIIKRKVEAKYKPIVTLMQYFGISAILFGLISGTFFGINLIDTGYTITDQSLIRMKDQGLPENILTLFDQIKGETFETRKNFSTAVMNLTGDDVYAAHKSVILKNAESKFKVLNSFRYLMQDPGSMFNLALILGAVQILFGMILKIINITKRQGFKYSLSMVGWVLSALTIVFFVGGSKFGIIEMSQVKFLFNGLLILSGILIFLLNNPGSNIFVRIGSGVWDTYGTVTGVFGDLLSYIRLFALGMSSSILGFVFNDISSQMLSVPYIGWLEADIRGILQKCRFYRRGN
jgi:V/A-type H+-transporting ATPase subunit I